MQNELKQISLRWISIFSDSESEYIKYNKQSDFLSSQNSKKMKNHKTVTSVSGNRKRGKLGYILSNLTFA